MDFSVAYNIVESKLETWLEGALAVLPNLVVALLVVIAFGLVARIIRNYSKKSLGRIAPNPFVAGLAANLLGVVVLSLGVSVALGILHLEKTVTSILAGAGILGLALGIAFQDIASNFFSGLLISFRKPFGVGDIIDTDGVQGEVMQVNLRNTVIKNFDGNQILVPNRKAVEENLTNYTRYGTRRVTVDVGVSYAEDLEHVEKVCLESIGELPGVLSDPPPAVHFTEFGGSSINFKVRAWIEYPKTSFLGVRNSMIKKIKEAFDREDISIPYPIRTIDFGIKGGLALPTIARPFLNSSDENNGAEIPC